MDNQVLLIVFIAVTALAVLLQAGILTALFVTVKKTTAHMERLAEEVKGKVMPTADVAHSMLVELRPKIETVAASVSDTSVLVKAQVKRIDETVTDVVDRTRLQVIRADQLLNRTMDRAEEASVAIHKTVLSPVRRLSALMQGLTAGVDYFAGSRKRRNGRNGSPDEMFI